VTTSTKKEKPNGRRERVGSVSNAGSSVTSCTRKPDEAAPFRKYHRLQILGQVVIVEQRFEGFTAMTPVGPIENPWRNQPFTNLKDCIKVVTYRMRKGYFPGMKKGHP
jgi:hypothetical protein